MTGGDSCSAKSRVIKESVLVCPMLTCTNYTECARLMKINYEAMEVWEPIDPWTSVQHKMNWQAMGALMQSVPNEVVVILGSLRSMKRSFMHQDLWSQLSGLGSASSGT